MLEKLKILFASFIASFGLFIILLTVSSLFTSQETSIKIAFLSLPFIYIFLFLYFYKIAVEKKSEIEYIFFPYKNNSRNLKNDDAKHTYTMSKEYIQKERKIAYKDGIKLLLIVPIILSFLLLGGVPFIAVVIYMGVTVIPIIYVTYKRTKEKFDGMNGYFITIYRGVLTIHEKGREKEFFIKDLEKIKIKYKNNTESIDYLELFTKNEILKKPIKLRGYENIEMLLEHLICFCNNF